MITRIEVMDRDTGATIFNKAYDGTNPLAPFADHYTTVAVDTGLTLGSILNYAGFIYGGLDWEITDAGERTTIRYGRFTAWLYRNPITE